jgi:predicted TIM-barrel fold metal-dependent hydrolase
LATEARIIPSSSGTSVRGSITSGLTPSLSKSAAAIARAYNNWLYDFCAVNPQRLIGAGMISPFGIDDAVVEARRSVKDLGFKGIFLRPNPVNGRNWHDPYYEPLWSQLETLDVPVVLRHNSVRWASS